MLETRLETIAGLDISTEAEKWHVHIETVFVLFMTWTMLCRIVNTSLWLTAIATSLFATVCPPTNATKKDVDKSWSKHDIEIPLMNPYLPLSDQKHVYSV